MPDRQYNLLLVLKKSRILFPVHPQEIFLSETVSSQPRDENFREMANLIKNLNTEFP